MSIIFVGLGFSKTHMNVQNLNTAPYDVCWQMGNTLRRMSYCVLSSSSMLLNVHRNHTDYYGRGAQDRHLDLLLVSESSMFFKFSVALRPHRSYGLLGTVTSGQPPRPSHRPLALSVLRTGEGLKYGQADRRQVCGLWSGDNRRT